MNKCSTALARADIITQLASHKSKNLNPYLLVMIVITGETVSRVLNYISDVYFALIGRVLSFVHDCNPTQV